MKDFYDLWMISKTFAFDGTVLSTALRRTLQRRETPWPAEMPTGLSELFAAGKSSQWRAFLTRERLAAAPVDFVTVIDDLRTFLMPLLADRKHLGRWPPGRPWTG